jgi:hypothetical protein
VDYQTSAAPKTRTKGERLGTTSIKTEGGKQNAHASFTYAIGAMVTHMVISSVRSNTPVGLPFGQTAKPPAPMGTGDNVNIAYHLDKVKRIQNIIIIINRLIYATRPTAPPTPIDHGNDLKNSFVVNWFIEPPVA